MDALEKVIEFSRVNMAHEEVAEEAAGDLEAMRLDNHHRYTEGEIMGCWPIKQAGGEIDFSMCHVLMKRLKALRAVEKVWEDHVVACVGDEQYEIGYTMTDKDPDDFDNDPTALEREATDPQVI